MTSVNPIAGNDGFTKVDNTVLDPQAVQSALAAGNLQTLAVAKGTATLTTVAGNYPVQHDGATLNLPQNAVVVRVCLVGDGTLATALTTTLEVGTSATDGGLVADGFHAPVTPGATVVGTLAPVVDQAAGSSNNFVSLNVGTAGAAVAGDLAVTVLYYMC
jgi:hypothetical protein